MALLKLNFLPGINKENTPYTQEGGWVDSDKIRFRSGKPEKIGGWDKYLDDPIVGTPRASHIWRVLDGTIYLALATEAKIYVETGGTVTDVTPVRDTVSLTDPVDTTSGSNVLTITSTGHGAETGAYVIISGSANVGGVPAAEINAEHQITVLDGDTFTVTVTTNASSTATGGGSVDVDYQINPGQVDGIYQYGWGADPWGSSTWGTIRTSGIPLEPLVWSLQNWGEDLIINPRGGGVYVWDATSPGNRATQITEAPHKVNHVLVTKDRHMVCLGCNAPGSGNSTSALDAMQIRWSGQEDYTDWVPTSINTAGDQLLTNGTEIVTAANTESQILVWTDDQIESMQYIGPPYTYGFQQVGTSTGIIGPNAWVAYNNVIYWMGDNAFYVFEGGTSVLPCTVQRFVFDALNTQQKRKVFTALDRENHELIWFYPTLEIEDTETNGFINDTQTTVTVATTAGFPDTGTIKVNDEFIDYTGRTDTVFTGCTRGARGTTASSHNDDTTVFYPDLGNNAETCRYVSYNVLDRLWWTGRLERTTWQDRGALKFPIATSRNGVIYNHEKGFDADGDPIVAFIKSADFDLGEGDQLMFIYRVIPDFIIEGSVELQFLSRYYPLSEDVRETVGVVLPTTTRIDTRIRGRQMALRIRSSGLGDYWKYGATRIDQRLDGRR